MSNAPPNFMPTAKIQRLKERAEILRKIRAYFESQGFLEVETPILSRDTIVDRYLNPFEIQCECGGGKTAYYLQTSPEFAMKRLLAAGASAIFQITHAFRQGDFGQTHNPEFTMLEWYRVGDNYESGIKFLSNLTNAILQRGEAATITLRHLFQQYTRLNPHTAPCRAFREFAIQNQIAFPESFSVEESARDDWTDLIFSEIIQPQLGRQEPIIVIDYLATQSQLAQTRIVIDEEQTMIDKENTMIDKKTSAAFSVSERFELFVDGLELANGYHELLDADILAERIHQTNALRISDGNQPLPETSRLLGAMRHGFPPCSGCALGIDRLIMSALGTKSIADVIAFPFDIA
jgi:lysyl-tRNA synthetase class 2